MTLGFHNRLTISFIPERLLPFQEQLFFSKVIELVGSNYNISNLSSGVARFESRSEQRVPDVFRDLPQPQQANTSTARGLDGGSGATTQGGGVQGTKKEIL